MKAIEIDNQVKIYITRRDSSEHELLLDLEDWDWVKDYTLNVTNCNGRLYVLIYDANGDAYLLHRVLFPGSKIVDHQNGNGLDNTKLNLRPGNQSQNMQNINTESKSASGIHGVYWKDSKQKWVAQVKLNYKAHYLGLYDSVSEAAEVVRQFRIKNMPFSKEAMI
jgi:hypothetical protein